jgi:hypothetical protein
MYHLQPIPPSLLRDCSALGNDSARLDKWKADEKRRGHEKMGQIRWYKEMSDCLCQLSFMSLVVSRTVPCCCP